ncbi:MAG: hypothetical protein J7M30_09080 [Deltaproteobacteria bacterium]|nr:hypothetical protein [Deltaproteobacteria bacterium]
MELEIARFLGNKDLLLNYFAQKSIVPVKSPPWADHPFGLRRNKKVKNREIGRLAGKKTMLLIMQALGIRDERSCKEVREHIKRLRKSYGYK